METTDGHGALWYAIASNAKQETKQNIIQMLLDNGCTVNQSILAHALHKVCSLDIIKLYIHSLDSFLFPVLQATILNVTRMCYLNALMLGTDLKWLVKLV